MSSCSVGRPTWRRPSAHESPDHTHAGGPPDCSLLVEGCEAGGGTGMVVGATSSPDVRADPFTDGNGWFYHYVRATDDYPATPFSSIDGEDRRRLLHGSWRVQHHDLRIRTRPRRTSVAFRPSTSSRRRSAPEPSETSRTWSSRLTRRGSPSRSTSALLSVHHTNPIFRTAEADKRHGIDSPEASMFRWAREEANAEPTSIGLPRVRRWMGVQRDGSAVVRDELGVPSPRLCRTRHSGLRQEDPAVLARHRHRRYRVRLPAVVPRDADAAT